MVMRRLSMKQVAQEAQAAQFDDFRDGPGRDCPGKNDPGQVGPESGGQSGDDQGLSQTADAADESVGELVDTGQSLEADAIAGVEDAADHPEKPVRSHEDFRRPDSVPPAQ